MFRRKNYDVICTGSLLGIRGYNRKANRGVSVGSEHTIRMTSMDFVTVLSGEVTLVEVKATTGNTKSSREVLSHPEVYHVSRCVKFGEYDVGESGGITTLPRFCVFLSEELDGGI